MLHSTCVLFLTSTSRHLHTSPVQDQVQLWMQSGLQVFVHKPKQRVALQSNPANLSFPICWARMFGGMSEWIQKDRQKAGGLGSVQQAVHYLNQDFQALKEESLQSRSLFEDPIFPAEPTSLGFKELGPFTAKTRGVEWKRPTVKRHQKLTDPSRLRLKLTCPRS